MSEPLDKQGCFLFALGVIILILITYSAIDMYADWLDTYHIRDLQRRVGELEQRR